jgi:hypothetical protein
MAGELVPLSHLSLTPAQYSDLADVPPELEWLANITNPKTRRAYKVDVEEFSGFTGLTQACGIAHRGPSACHRLAQASGSAQAVARQYPAQAFCFVFAV